MDKNYALQLLQKSVNNPTAQFRQNQREAIDILVNKRKKLLVVERTGWGKSSVYFISTRILRDQGKGPTIIISPLLALMRNQIDAAQRIGIKAVSINSTNRDDWSDIKFQVLNDNVDVLLISPERLANDDFVENVLRPIANRIGLFVVDEAHCISDWGHDFRTDYRRITNILNFMPAGMPILGTTATANKRVIADVVSQLGNIDVIRGSLVRESLILQNIKLSSQAERLAWLKENIPQLRGSGIIYALTRRDANQVARYLKKYSISAEAYYSDVKNEDFENSDKYRIYLEEQLLANKIKVLVSTSALGMGYDKPDLGFVVHYQAPGSIIAYYQQVGRAGRSIDTAYGILLSGQEDEDVLTYFMQSAFPNEAHVDLILDTLSDYDGLSVPELLSMINLRRGKIEQVLKYIGVEKASPIYKDGSKWMRTAVPYKMDTEKIERLTSQKQKEWEEVQQYITYTGCLMNYLQHALDDENITPCGKCSNCVSKSHFSLQPLHENIVEAMLFLKHSEFDIEPRKRFELGSSPPYQLPIYLKKNNLSAETGKVLSIWGDAGWGKMVADDKHNGHFRDELVIAIADMINRWHPDPAPTWITCVPSKKHPNLVPDFANRLAQYLGMPFFPIVEKIKDTSAQKAQQNSYFQCHNLDGAFNIPGEIKSEPVLLIDDAVDSRWTFTIIAALLKQAGSGPVYPVALTSTAVDN